MILAIDRVVKEEAAEWMYQKMTSHSSKLSRHYCEAYVKFRIDYLRICEICQSNTLTFDDSVYVGFWDIKAVCCCTLRCDSVSTIGSRQ
jgi:hypothetical protein